MSNPDLPDDLINVILLRLPIKPICRFKCVSKPWRSLFSSPQFVKENLKLHIDDNKGLIFTPSLSDCGPYILTLAAAAAANDGVARKVPLPIQQWRPMVAGSCDGLVLLILQNKGCRQVLFNPITLETAMIRDDRPLSLRSCTYGFGYDCSSDDYKIVSLCKVHGNDGSFVDIYSLRTKCWRRIANCPYVLEDSPFNKTRPAPGVFLNGRLHWFGYDASGEYVHCGLICFDLAREEFVEGLLPININGAFDFDIKIFEGCLALVSEPYWQDVGGDGKLSIDVWVMKEYGVGDSWTKRYATIFPEKEGEEFDAAYNVVCVLNEDEIVLKKSTEESEQLVAYNRRNGVSRDLVIAGAPEQFNSMMPFRGSLLSPNFEG